MDIHKLNSKLYPHTSYKDNRGSVSVLEHDISNINWKRTLVSYNENKNTFRGMHYQHPNSQYKYVKVLKGSVIDFLFNLETKEVEFYELNDSNALFVPTNYAHGYFTLEEHTIVSYLISNDYSPKDEKIICYKDILEISNYLDKFENITISNKDLLI